MVASSVYFKFQEVLIWWEFTENTSENGWLKKNLIKSDIRNGEFDRFPVQWISVFVQVIVGMMSIVSQTDLWSKISETLFFCFMCVIVCHSKPNRVPSTLNSVLAGKWSSNLSRISAPLYHQHSVAILDAVQILPEDSRQVLVRKKRYFDQF